MPIAASDSVNRLELEKLEKDFISLKTQLVKFRGIDPTHVTTEIGQLFVKDVETVYVETRKLIVEKWKDTSSTSRGASKTSSLSSKKEFVKLTFKVLWMGLHS